MYHQLKAIIYYNFKELTSSKALWNVAFFAIGIIVISLISSQLSYGIPERIVLNCGLSALNISCLFMAFYLGTTLLSFEYNNKTLYLVFSRPISRSLFLLGKVSALSLLLFINTFLLSAVTLILIRFFSHQISMFIIHQMIFFYFQGVIVFLLLVLFSLKLHQFICVFGTFTLLLIGHGLDDFDELMATSEQTLSSYKIISKILHYIIPHFYRFDIQKFILYGSADNTPLGLSFIASSYLYGLIMIIVLILLSCFIIETKELD